MMEFEEVITKREFHDFRHFILPFVKPIGKKTHFTVIPLLCLLPKNP